MTAPIRVALVADLLSEQWPSMDLVADQLHSHLQASASDALTVELVRPTLRDRGRGIGRYVNRYWDYPRWLGPRACAYDVFHVIDHSYAHLVHVLPPSRTLVTCHDVDAFMPLVDATAIPTRLPNAVTRRVLSGLRRAARITCDSAATLEEATKFDLFDRARASVVPIGVHPAIGPAPNASADAAIAALIGPAAGANVDLLHVGSCIPRKRIDVLLRVLRAFREVEPRARLLKAGGTLNADQRALARALGVEQHIVQLPFLDTPMLAALYRRADAVLVTSAREGFGLPVAEALAAGAAVVATDLPVLREVGGNGVSFVALDDRAGWVDAVRTATARTAGGGDTARAESTRRVRSRFSWQAYANAVSDIYASLASQAAS